jgi:hypothetical protein
MTPQLQQAIMLLQISREELADTIREEILRNPILDDAVDTASEEPNTTEADEALSREDARDAVSTEQDDSLVGIDLRVLEAFHISGRGTAVVVDAQLERWPYGGTRHVSIHPPGAPAFSATANLELTLFGRAGKAEERATIVLKGVELESVPVGTIIRSERRRLTGR